MNKSEKEVLMLFADKMRAKIYQANLDAEHYEKSQNYAAKSSAQDLKWALRDVEEFLRDVLASDSMLKYRLELLRNEAKKEEEKNRQDECETT